MSEAAQFISDGFEGIILRHPAWVYEFIRSRGLLKWKPTAKTWCRIVGYKEGIGWTTGMLGSFLVEFPDSGAQFYVGTGQAFTKVKRIEYWKDPESYINKMLLVIHEPMNAATEIGIPICTRGIEIK
jgi:ATP-dependent DNA ligase